MIRMTFHCSDHPGKSTLVVDTVSQALRLMMEAAEYAEGKGAENCKELVLVLRDVPADDLTAAEREQAERLRDA